MYGARRQDPGLVSTKGPCTGSGRVIEPPQELFELQQGVQAKCREDGPAGQGRVGRNKRGRR